MKTIQSLENSAYVKDELKLFEKSVLKKKGSFNKTHHENLLKEDQLEQLEKQLEMLAYQCDDYSGQQSYLKSKNNEYKVLHRKLKEQLRDQLILENMLNTRKAELAKMSEPINKKKKKINTLNFKIEKHSRKIQKESSGIFHFNKEIEAENKFLENIFKERENKIDSEVKNFVDKKKFRYCIKKEFEKNAMLEKHTNEAKELLELENRLNKIKENDLRNDEIKAIDAFCMREEEKFLEIQKVTNIVSVTDMYPHFLYLMENESELKESVEAALRQIDVLNKEREKISKELEELRFKALSNKNHNKEVQILEEKFKQRVAFIDNYEEYVEKLENVVVTATNSISRLVYQLDLTHEIGQLEPENLLECFKRCRNKFDILIEFIKKSDFDLTESVNTDINYKRSPNFLNLNTKPLKKIE